MKDSLSEKVPSRVEVKSLEDMRAFNKDKKRLKGWQKGHKSLMVSESLVRQIPRVMGPQLGKIGKFPLVVKEGESPVE
jgi:large subunit ribosomal protein L10Ae